jgi:hypothetical protein
MGTSTSFRSPPVPRWQAFATALRSDVPLERLRSELFNAGVEWESALADQSVASFAVQVVLSFETLPSRLREADRPETAILEAVADARRASTETGSASSALPLAERALVGALMRAVSGDVSLAQLSAQEAAARFERQRGEPGKLLGSFVGELLSQYARHVTAREMGAMSASRTSKGAVVPGLSIAQSKRLARSLAAEAESVGRRIGDIPQSVDVVRGRWATLIGEAFERGRVLPESST